eukprot:TRINITY_DN2826_c1_g1_i4.p5 TRINITY_DN2826_c1_g1~~TRINITY_DN2826_c1_g1_i4.p5  ORF type:complete len:110 (-),score=0.73 TRINITY_DN2826_c1_g1_i4:184-513(-)
MFRYASGKKLRSVSKRLFLFDLDCFKEIRLFMNKIKQNQIYLLDLNVNCVFGRVLELFRYILVGKSQYLFEEIVFEVQYQLFDLNCLRNFVNLQDIAQEYCRDCGTYAC